MHLSRFLDPAAPKSAPTAPNSSSLAESPEVADRLCAAPYSEAAQRLPAHRFQQRMTFSLVSKGSKEALDEQVLIVQAQNGDFRVKVENTSGQGYEVVAAGGRCFLRTRYSPFHERAIQDGQHLLLRDQAATGFAAIYRLFRGRLRFEKQNLVLHHGRKAMAYTIHLSGEMPRLPGTSPPPAIPPGVEKYVYPADVTPAERDRWRDKAEPEQVSGTLLVDIDSGALVRVDFSGRLSIDEAGAERSLSLTANVTIDGFGNPPSIEPPSPELIQPPPETIAVDTRPLDFLYGKGFTATLGPPAGVARRDKPLAGDAGGPPSNP